MNKLNNYITLFKWKKKTLMNIFLNKWQKIFLIFTSILCNSSSDTVVWCHSPSWCSGNTKGKSKSGIPNCGGSSSCCCFRQASHTTRWSSTWVHASLKYITCRWKRVLRSVSSGTRGRSKLHKIAGKHIRDVFIKLNLFYAGIVFQLNSL